MAVLVMVKSIGQLAGGADLPKAHSGDVAARSVLSGRLGAVLGLLAAAKGRWGQHAMGIRRWENGARGTHLRITIGAGMGFCSSRKLAGWR